jgi:hypothetical protein
VQIVHRGASDSVGIFVPAVLVADNGPDTSKLSRPDGAAGDFTAGKG